MRFTRKLLNGLAVVLVFLAGSCDMSMDSAGNTGGHSEGSLTISLGNGSKAISQAAPGLPSFSTVTITVSKGGATLASSVFTGNGPHTLSVPEGSGYRVELDAQVASPTTFGLRYAGVKDNASTGSPVYISLSVTETALVGKRSPASVIYRSFADAVSGAPPLSLTGYPAFFFDRYGRLFTDEWSSVPPYTIDMIPSWGAAAEMATLNVLDDALWDLAHTAGTDRVYYCHTDIDNDSTYEDLSFTRLSDLETGNAPFTVVNVSFPAGTFFGFKVSNLAVSGSTVFFGGFTSVPEPAFIKGTVDAGNTFIFETGIIMPTSVVEIRNMEVIDGTLYVLAAVGSYDEAILYAYNADTLAPLGSAPIQQPSSLITNMESNIAGWGKDRVYVYYYEYSSPYSGIIEINANTLAISARKDWT